MARPPVYLEDYVQDQVEKIPVQVKLAVVKATAGVQPTAEPKKQVRNEIEQDYNPAWHRSLPKKTSDQGSELVLMSGSGGQFEPN